MCVCVYIRVCVCVCFSSFSLFNTRLCWLDWFSFPSQYGLKNTECFQFNDAGGNRKWNSCSEDWPNLQHTRKANIYGFPRRPAHLCISKCSGLRGFVSQPGTNKSRLNGFFPCVILKHSLLGLPLLPRLLCTQKAFSWAVCFIVWLWSYASVFPLTHVPCSNLIRHVWLTASPTMLSCALQTLHLFFHQQVELINLHTWHQRVKS